MIETTEAYLRAAQDPETGGWSVPTDERLPHFPAITGLVLTGLVLDQTIDPNDATVTRAAEYLLSWQQADGGIYDRMLPSYGTSISLSALAPLDEDPAVRDAIARAQAFLKRVQYSEAADPTAGGDESPDPVDPEHPFYGGVGYGKHGRPDLSNLNLALQGLHDSGTSPDDASFQRALAFLERTQMLDSVNPMPYADGSSQGGFIYATAPNAAALSVGDGGPALGGDGLGQSQAGLIEETLDDGTTVSRLRAYGSMTYAGFKSYLFASLERDDPRVRGALRWIEHNYTLAENPGMGEQGLYYYFVTFARALDAWGEPTIERATDGTPEPRDWANDLIDRLAELQQPDGSFEVRHERWLEDDPVLISAYSLIALRHAVRGTPAPE